MLLSSVLTSVKSFIETTGINTAQANNNYPVFITPDERPFAFAGDNSISLYGNEFIKIDPTKQQRKFEISFNLCVSRRVTVSPHDRLYHRLYQESFVSLSDMSELITYALDNNNSLLSLISSSVITSVNSIVNTLQSIDSSGSDGYVENIITNVGEASVIGPIIGLGFNAQPIPRFDDFFTAFSTKKLTETAGRNEVIISGYSMICRFIGPSIILPQPCF